MLKAGNQSVVVRMATHNTHAQFFYFVVVLMLVCRARWLRVTTGATRVRYAA